MELKIRRAINEDCMNVFDLSNDSVVRNNSVDRNSIKLEDHILWFEKKISDPNCEYYIVENDKNEFVAQVRFDNTDGKVYIGISIVEKFRGRSLGRDIIQRATEMTSYSEITAKIRKMNIASYRSFINAGYKWVQTDDEYYLLIFVKNTNNNE